MIRFQEKGRLMVVLKAVFYRINYLGISTLLGVLVPKLKTVLVHFLSFSVTEQDTVSTPGREKTVYWRVRCFCYNLNIPEDHVLFCE